MSKYVYNFLGHPVYSVCILITAPLIINIFSLYPDCGPVNYKYIQSVS